MNRSEDRNSMDLPPLSSFFGSRPLAELLSCGAFDSPSTPGTLGRLDRFEILSLIGEGGMGLVYLAREPCTDTRVAIKIMRPQLGNDPHMVHRFLTEARHMYRLSHPHILRVLEVSDRKEGPYYVMPYIKGGNLLNQYKPGQPMAEDRILAITRQVAEALVYAHSKGIIHRDIKPGNVLLDQGGNAYLSDFGLVRTVFNDSMLGVSSDNMEGTAHYMSPAMARGDAEDTRCDIYAFGALCYELITGQPPYSGATAQIILDKVRKGPPEAIRSLNARAGSAMVRIIEGCMARNLCDRYATMANVVADLDRVDRGEQPLGPHQKNRRSLSRMAVLLCGMLSFFGLGVLSIMGWGELGKLKKLLPWSGDNHDLYMVVDLSHGSATNKFPVSYLDDVPKGGWTSEYKTEKLVLRRIEAGSFLMGSPENELGRGSDETLHRVTLTDPYYMGVFEITQRQWELVKGNRPSRFYVDYAARPVEQVGYDDIRGAAKGASWPYSSVVDPESFIGVLRDKTGIRSFDLPTEAQWEYACRAGTSTALSSGENLTGVGRCVTLAKLGRHNWNAHCGDQVAPNEGGTTVAGSYPANPWGLYDMHGNILEWCLDWRAPYTGDVIDPLGAYQGSGRVERGVAWYGPAKFGRSANRQSHSPGSHEDFQGFRIAMTLCGTKDRCGTVGDMSGVQYEADGMFTYKIENGSARIMRYAGKGAKVVIPDTIKGRPVSSIESEAFMNCSNMTSVSIPDSVTHIGNNTFGYCHGLTNINLSSYVISLGCNPFNCCSNLQTVSVDKMNPVYSSEDGVVFDKHKNCLVSCPAGKKGVYCIPGSVSHIGPGVFFGCGALSSVKIPSSVRTISLWAFKYCTGLTRMVIPESVVSMNNNTFCGCVNLTDVCFEGKAPRSDSEATIFSGANQVTVHYRPGTVGWGKEFGGRPTAAWND